MSDDKTDGVFGGYRRGRCPSENVARIGKFYERKALKADAAFSGAPPGADGPVLLVLRTRSGASASMLPASGLEGSAASSRTRRSAARSRPSALGAATALVKHGAPFRAGLDGGSGAWPFADMPGSPLLP